jgi:hypothetical protein
MEGCAMRASCRVGRLWWIACAVATSLPAWAVDDAPPLFASSEVRTVEVPGSATTGPARLGRIDARVLRMDRIRLDLPDGRHLVARRTATDVRDPEQRLWSGTVDGVAGSAVSLTHQRDGIVGVLYVGTETYEIVPFWTGEVLLYGVGSECRPPYSNLAAGGGYAQTSGQPKPMSRVSQADRLAGATRRVVAFYTPASRVRWSGYGGIEARIEAALAALNAQSTNDPRWELEGLREVEYSENGDARAAVRWLRHYLEGTGASVPSGEADAGTVLLITEDSNLCGVAAPADPAQTRVTQLHAVYSICLTDPSLAAQLNGRNGRAMRDTVAEDSTVGWKR